MQTNKIKLKDITVAIIFVFLTIIMTFPLLFKISTHIPGFFSTDEPYNPIWDSWRVKYSLLHNLSLRHFPCLAYPYGIDIFIPPTYIWIGLHYLLSLLTTPVLTYNIQVLSNFFLSGMFTYLLVFYLTKNRPTAISSGIIFAFCPYQFVRSWQHLTATYNQCLSFVLFSLFLMRNNGAKIKFLFLISLVLLFSFDYYLAYFTSISIFIFFIYLFIYRYKLKFRQEGIPLIKDDLIYFNRVSVIVIIFSIFVFFPLNYSLIKNVLTSSSLAPSAWNVIRRPFGDLFEQSAKPLSYLLPASVHPIFGKFTERFVGSFLYGVSYTEHTLYLGWTPLFLAFYALRQWRKKRKLQITNSKLQTDSRFQAPNSKLRTNEDFYIGFFVLLAIVAWFFSQPPWWKIGPIKIYMPSFFMYKILPMFRAYCRFGIVVMLAVAVLAGFGLKFILERFKSQKTKIVLTCLFSGLVLFEFWNWPPYKVIDISKVPSVYYWLKEQPEDFAIAEYPLDADSPNEMYKFYQTKHEKKIINGTIPFTYANKVTKTITKLSDPKTAGILKWMQVKYVLVHKQDYLKTELIEWIEELEKIPKNPCLKFIKSFPVQDCPDKNIMCLQKTGPIDVYEVVAAPTQPEIKNSEN